MTWIMENGASLVDVPATWEARATQKVQSRQRTIQEAIGVAPYVWREKLSCRQVATLFDVRGGHSAVVT